MTVQHEVEGYQRDQMHRSINENLIMTKEDGHWPHCKCLETDQNPAHRPR
jgi:hypothetical protein